MRESEDGAIGPATELIHQFIAYAGTLSYSPFQTPENQQAQEMFFTAVRETAQAAGNGCLREAYLRSRDYVAGQLGVSGDELVNETTVLGRAVRKVAFPCGFAAPGWNKGA